MYTRTRKKIKNHNQQKNAPEDAIEVLHKLHNNVQYRPIFEEICCSPFHLIYWLPEQFQIWRDSGCHKQTTLILIQIEDIAFGVDSDKISLFSLVHEANGSVISFAEAVTEHIDRNFTDRFLSTWLRSQSGSKMKLPKSIALPFDLNVLKAVVLSVNSSSIEVYNTTCLKLLLSEREELQPACIVRIDSESFFKFIKHLNCITSIKLARTREFIIKVLILISLLSNDMQIFEMTVINLMIMLQSESIDKKVRAIKSNLDKEFKHYGIVKIFEALNKKLFM